MTCPHSRPRGAGGAEGGPGRGTVPLSLRLTLQGDKESPPAGGAAAQAGARSGFRNHSPPPAASVPQTAARRPPREAPAATRKPSLGEQPFIHKVRAAGSAPSRAGGSGTGESPWGEGAGDGLGGPSRGRGLWTCVGSRLGAASATVTAPRPVRRDRPSIITEHTAGGAPSTRDTCWRQSERKCD